MLLREGMILQYRHITLALLNKQGGNRCYLLLFRSQTTKGIWMARCAGIEPCTLVMDLEGTDGRERGEVFFHLLTLILNAMVLFYPLMTLPNGKIF